jgi:hypothetical protein
MKILEFDCVECGRHIKAIIGNKFLQGIHPNTCGACYSIPGWWRKPEIAKMIDPENLRKPPTTQ